jgi:hypothetical protein
MRPNPIPRHIVAIANTQGTKIPRNAHRPDMRCGGDFLDDNARGEWVVAKLLALSARSSSSSSRWRITEGASDAPSV